VRSLRSTSLPMLSRSFWRAARSPGGSASLLDLFQVPCRATVGHPGPTRSSGQGDRKTRAVVPAHHQCPAHRRAGSLATARMRTRNLVSTWRTVAQGAILQQAARRRTRPRDRKARRPNTLAADASHRAKKVYYYIVKKRKGGLVYGRHLRRPLHPVLNQTPLSRILATCSRTMRTSIGIPLAQGHVPPTATEDPVAHWAPRRSACRISLTSRHVPKQHLQHLAILRDKGILASRKDANRVYYR